MEFLILLCLGVAVGIIAITITQKPLLRKRKYGYSKESSFDYYNTIDSNILQCDQDNQHANQED